MDPSKPFIYLLFFLVSCSSVKGVYRWTGNNISPDNYELIIKNDNQFKYQGWSDVLGSDTIRGNWEFRSDTLFLKKFNKDTSDWITIKRAKVDTVQNEFLLELMDENGDYLIGADIYIDGLKNSITLNEEDYVRLDETPNEIRINYLSMNFTLGSSEIVNSNVFRVHINFKNIDLDYFYINPMWLKRGNQLIQIDENGRLVENGVFKK